MRRPVRERDRLPLLRRGRRRCPDEARLAPEPREDEERLRDAEVRRLEGSEPEPEGEESGSAPGHRASTYLGMAEAPEGVTP